MRKLGVQALNQGDPSRLEFALACRPGGGLAVLSAACPCGGSSPVWHSIHRPVAAGGAAWAVGGHRSLEHDPTDHELHTYLVELALYANAQRRALGQSPHVRCHRSRHIASQGQSSSFCQRSWQTCMLAAACHPHHARPPLDPIHIEESRSFHSQGVMCLTVSVAITIGALGEIASYMALAREGASASRTGRVVAHEALSCVLGQLYAVWPNREAAQGTRQSVQVLAQGCLVFPLPIARALSRQALIVPVAWASGLAPSNSRLALIMIIGLWGLVCLVAEYGCRFHNFTCRPYAVLRNGGVQRASASMRIATPRPGLLTAVKWDPHQHAAVDQRSGPQCVGEQCGVAVRRVTTGQCLGEASA